MSKEEAAKTGEVVETLKNLWSPMDLDRDLYFHLPLSPRSPGFCLSPLWNFHEDNYQEFTGDIHVTSTTNVLPQSPGETLLFESLAGNHETLKQSPQQCLTDRITQALAYIKKSTDRQVLAQVWVPVKMGTQYVLTTSDQPFLLSLDCNGLAQYRLVSSMYMFSIDAINVDLGLPGRVFRTKLPEWSPNVQYYSIAEYPQLIHAIRCNVRGTLALPLFVSGGSCIGVLELIMTSQKINYAPEIDLLYRALEAVELKSSETFKLPHTHVADENDQIELVEILELLTIVSETYKLPLAQTWIPSSNRHVVPCGGSLRANTSFEGRLMKQVCLSTSNLAFYVVDAHMWGFREASTEHSLLEGQGVVGRAYLSLKSCFCKDVNQFCKIEYPLVNYARLFGLHSCFAVPICDTQTWKNIYILEFFLPTTLANFRYLQKLLNFLSATISQSSPNLHMISHKECSKDGAIELINLHVDMKPAES
ncbi:hypothetical protein ACH5RR_002999 [Cinchona calisaya]|uniref:NLP1-9 GAF domain-containing protein n=1 Tax=Cinchona calisaya TaxID=153742 RepID=A0ABD3ATP6_9GENT